MHNRRIVIGVALAITLAARDAGADIYHLRSPSTVETERGTRLSLPPGYFLDEETWQERDLEMRRLQALETRLSAENESLRVDATGTPWGRVVLAGVIGVAVGLAAAWAAK